MGSTEPSARDVPEGQTFCQFICGATEPHDLWMFADFMAASKVFIETGGITGTYINTWPINAYLKKHSRVTWGYGVPNTGIPLVAYNKNDRAWWKNIHPSAFKELPAGILRSLVNLGRRAKFPDKVNVFIFCRQSRQGWLQIGGARLLMSDLSETISRAFNHGVQVNIVVPACYSGIMLDKIKDLDRRRRTVQISASAVKESWSFTKADQSEIYQGSPLIIAYVNSLVLGLRAVQAKDPTRTMQQHIDHVNSASISTSQDKIGHSKSGHTVPRKTLDAVLNIFLRSYIVHTLCGGGEGGDVKQQRFKPPHPGPQIPLHLKATSASTEQMSIWIRAVEAEMGYLRVTPGWSLADTCPNNDKGFFSNIIQLGNTKDNQWAITLLKQMLLSLRWRFRLQECFFFTFDELLRDELISETALLQPMDLSSHEDAVDDIVSLLEGFDNGAVCGLYASQYEDLKGIIGHGGFEMPIRWLAILILRSNPETELSHIFSRFERTELFGKYQPDNLTYVPPVHIRDMPRACEAKTVFQASSYELGFFLPHGKADEALKQWAKTTAKRYTDLKDVFEMVLGEGSWGSTQDFLSLLESYRTRTLEERLGPRWRQSEVYVDELSPVSGTALSSSAGLLAKTTASSVDSPSPSAEESDLNVCLEDEGDTYESWLPYLNTLE